MVHRDLHPPKYPQTERLGKRRRCQGDNSGVGCRGSPGEYEIIEERERADEAQDVAGWEGNVMRSDSRNGMNP